jgi:hypothetical protein
MTDPKNRACEDMLADLDASDAEIAAGDLVPGEVVRATIQTAIDRLARASQQKVGPRR